MRATKSISSVLVVALVSAGLVGCESKSGTGTLIGAGAGAGGGALIGSAVAGKGQRNEGALVGAGIGALAGGLGGYGIGRQGDKKDEARKRERDREERVYTDRPTQVAAPAATVNPATGQPGQALTMQEVILWSQRGVREDIIIDRVDRSGTRFNLTAGDESQLRTAGVSEAVIRSMKAKG